MEKISSQSWIWYQRWDYEHLAQIHDDDKVVLRKFSEEIIIA